MRRLAPVFSALVLHAFARASIVLTILPLPGAAADPPTPEAALEQRHALRECDRFLDHHPTLEDELRLNPALPQDARFLENNAELRALLAATPHLGAALRAFPRYFLFRALLREAREPLQRSEIAPLHELFDRAPPLERALARRPGAIRDPAFLATHPELRDFLQAHPPLDHAFLP